MRVNRIGKANHAAELHCGLRNADNCQVRFISAFIVRHFTLIDKSLKILIVVKKLDAYRACQKRNHYKVKAPDYVNSKMIDKTNNDQT